MPAHTQALQRIGHALLSGKKVQADCYGLLFGSIFSLVVVLQSPVRGLVSPQTNWYCFAQADTHHLIS